MKVSDLHLFCKNSFLEVLASKFILKDMCYDQPGEIKMKFLPRGRKGHDSTPESYSVYYQEPIDHDSVKFHIEEYQKHLHVTKFSRILMYGDLVTSTQAILSKNIEFTRNLPNGFVFVANQQTSGRGRGQNLWTSPEGCLCFSFVLNHHEAKYLSLVQHIMSIAVVHSIRSVYSNLDVGIKWPNDIYVGKKTKIGGILVGANNFHDTNLLIIGCGLNIENSEPTTCLNDLIKEYNISTGSTYDLLTKEVVLAQIMTTFEKLYQTLLTSGWNKELSSLYYKYWLHQDQHVKVEGLGDVIIIGLDEYGYLVAKDENNKIHTLEPNGNSFDMMNGLIVQKK